MQMPTKFQTYNKTLQTFICRSGFLLALVVFAAPASADLVEMNDTSLTQYQSGDNNNITLDTSTGLQWLDVSTTTNTSFNQMSALLGVGELADFRYATISEVDGFFNNLDL